MPRNSWAASSQDATLQVRPFAHIPPATITDLVASPASIEGQIQLQWTAPSVLPGSDLTAYQLKITTFSLASVGGSTSTWWNAAGTAFFQGFYGESPGASVTRTVGPPGSGSSHLASLYPGATYYFAVRSADDLGVTFDFWSSIASTSRGSPFDATPGVPTGLGISAGSDRLNLFWADLTTSAKGIDFDRYQIYRSTRSGQGFVLLGSTTTTSYSDTTAAIGTRYYYHITAIDRGSPDYLGTALESAASSEVTDFLGSSVTNGKPAKPDGLYATAGINGPFILTWHAVTNDIVQNPLPIDHYRIDRYNALDNTVVASQNIPATSNSYSDTTNGRTNFYRVVAVGIDGTESDPSDYMDSSVNANRYILAPDDITTMVLIPTSLQSELLRETNGYGEDIDLVLEHRTADEVDTTLRSYRVAAYLSISRREVPAFRFSRALIAIHLGYGASIQNSSALSARQKFTLTQTGNTLSPQDQLAAQLISVYWFNGSSFIPIGSPILTGDQSLSVTVRNLGTYQLRAVRIGTGFKLGKGSPYPRILTPHDKTQNNRAFFFFDNPTDEDVSGTIYDLRGAKVRDIQVDGLSPAANCMVWDAHDSKGSIVPPGIYLYKIRAGKESATGTLVVAQ